MRRALPLAVAAIVALGLAGCGRKGQPHSPEHAFYPQKYPAVLLPEQPAGPTEPQADEELRQLQERQERERAGPQTLVPAPAAPPAQPGFQDLSHPQADTTSGNSRP